MEKKAELIKIPSLVQRYLPTGFTSHPISSYLIALHPNCKSLDKDLQSCKRLMVIISGPSGVGKNSLVQSLNPEYFYKVRTATTRARRPGESKNAYYWYTLSRFNRLIQKQAFVEYAAYEGNLYGILRKNVEQVITKGKIPIFVVDPRIGSKKLLHLKENGEQLFRNTLLVSLFIIPSDLKELKDRLIKRNPKQAEERYNAAKTDLKFMSYTHYIVVNKEGDLKKLAKEIENFLIELSQKIQTKE